jgi:hypothetical protein
MSQIHSIAAARARRSGNMEIPFRDLLHLLLSELDEGRFTEKAKAVVIVTDQHGDPADERFTIHDYRCGMSLAEELAWLEYRKHCLIRQWENS